MKLYTESNPGKPFGSYTYKRDRQANYKNNNIKNFIVRHLNIKQRKGKK